ncbi:hypothetical protein [Leptospira interrogans]|uniref:hypothetical protein n=1 Tax=Leptospira interrogans TaxID=173 RepID=UPI0002974AB5|nr:hypothetical protein [Leptospira interrogans]EKR16756.1 hypothetical protein LEP1GSC019_0055 [Leptospira interrogans serovar Pyrogenes str. 2006006960]
MAKVIFLIIFLLSNSLIAEDITVDDRSFNRLKFLIENPKPHSRIPLTRKEAIISLGFFGDERHSEYLCNLLTKESYKEEIKEIFRALSMHNGKVSLKCLIE